MVNHYETAFILTPVLSDSQMKEAVEKFKNLLTTNGAEIVNEELWGLKKLAYPIEKKSTGFYVVLQFSGEPTLVDTLEVQFRRDERILRFLTFRLDKYALEYAQRRIKKVAQDVKPEKKEETV
ncbi:MAG: 30S ribosomal protein S6 [Prevotellaceae bacterium]|jgi:small subunit ribosomal protein S6|nr:30S ribosomal protein S6 [Prevotellaceae bacterium]